MKQYPYRFHIALDGNGLNGLEGRAGVCQFLFCDGSSRFIFTDNTGQVLRAASTINGGEPVFNRD